MLPEHEHEQKELEMNQKGNQRKVITAFNWSFDNQWE